MHMNFLEASSNASTLTAKEQQSHDSHFNLDSTPDDVTCPPKQTKADSPDQTWSSSISHFLDQPPASMPIHMIAGGGIFFLSLLAWAWCSHIDQMGIAYGKLIPRGETYKVESIQAGKISRISVKEGEAVKSGQIIAELDSKIAKGEVERLNQQFNALKQELAQKKLLLEQASLENTAYGQIASTEIIGHKKAIESAQKKATVLERLIQQQQQEKEELHKRQQKLLSLRRVSDTRSKALVSEVKAHQERLQRLTRLEAQGAISKEAVFLADQGLRQTQKQFTESQLHHISNVSEQIFQGGQALRNLETNILQRQGDLSTAVKEIEQLQLHLKVKENEVVRSGLEANQKINVLQQDITRIQAQIEETQKLLETSILQLEQKFLKAPVNGVVLLSTLKNMGKVIHPGQTIVEIAPHDSPLVVMARLPNKDAGFVNIGMSVQLQLEAYPYQEYGVIPGKITSISADAVADQKLGEVYLVEIEIERDYVIENKNKIYFKPGQTAVANIMIRKRRVLDIILDPIKKLQSVT